MFGFGRKAQKERTGHETVLRVEGMTCMHCKKSVENALRSVQGVESASAYLVSREAVIIGSVAREVLVKAVEDAGYSVPA